MLNPIDSSRVNALQRAEEWLDRFHEITSDQSGERLRHFRQRQCVERNNSWDGASTTFHDWERRQNEFCQQALDAESDLETLLPILRSVAADAAAMLDAAPKFLANLRSAIVDIHETDDTGALCQHWFEKQQRRFHRLKSEDVSAVSCRGCSKRFRDPAGFQEHFKLHPTELRHAFPCSGFLGTDDCLDDDASLVRHLENHHHDAEELKGQTYIDTRVHIEGVDQAAAQCLDLYRGALGCVLEARSRAAADTVIAEGLRETQEWLDQFHAFAADTGGERRQHLLEARPWGWPVFEVYGEQRPEWSEALDAFAQRGRDLEHRLVRVLCIASVIAPEVVDGLKEAGNALSNLYHGILKVTTDRDSFKVWLEIEEKVLTAETAEDCHFCGKPVADAKHLRTHFGLHHSSLLAPGSRVWMSPAEHLRNVEQEEQSCRRIYMQTLELIRESSARLRGEDSQEGEVTPPADRDSRKPSTKAKHLHWQEEYRRLSSENPNRSDNWIAIKIAGKSPSGGKRGWVSAQANHPRSGAPRGSCG